MKSAVLPLYAQFLRGFHILKPHKPQRPSLMAGFLVMGQPSLKGLGQEQRHQISTPSGHSLEVEQMTRFCRWRTIKCRTMSMMILDTSIAAQQPLKQDLIITVSIDMILNSIQIIWTFQ